jgi:hypothetical protein
MASESSRAPQASISLPSPFGRWTPSSAGHHSLIFVKTVSISLSLLLGRLSFFFKKKQSHEIAQPRAKLVPV